MAEWLQVLLGVAGGYAIAGIGNALLGDPLGHLGKYLRDRLGL